MIVARKRSLEGEDEKPPKWRVRLGERAKNIRNPIREIMDTIAGKATQLPSLVASGALLFFRGANNHDMVNAISIEYL